MSLKEHYVDGAALASIELHRSMITLMVLHKAVPREVAIELIDQAQQRLERVQAAAGDKSSIAQAAQAARHHIELLLLQLRSLPEAAKPHE